MMPAALALLAVSLFIGLRLLIVHPPPTPALIVQSTDAHRMLSTAPDARIGRLLQEPMWSLKARGNVKLVALTFDDGPYPVGTPLLLDVLRDLGVKATFFLIGKDAELFPEITARISSEGHEIADHTLTHPANFEALGPAQVREELLDGAAVLGRYTHDPAIHTMMRPPHGRFTERTVKAAQAAGFHVILWNEDPGDWRTVGAEHLAHDVEKYATAPDILLLHNGRMQTVEMLPEIVGRFRRAGYRFVTVGELMRLVPTTQILHPLRHPI